MIDFDFDLKKKKIGLLFSDNEVLDGLPEENCWFWFIGWARFEEDFWDDEPELEDLFPLEEELFMEEP